MTLLQLTAPHLISAMVDRVGQANALFVRNFLAFVAFIGRLSEMVNEVDTGQYEVMIEGEGHPWAKDTISVAEIRELGKLHADAPVIEQADS